MPTVTIRCGVVQAVDGHSMRVRMFITVLRNRQMRQTAMNLSMALVSIAVQHNKNIKGGGPTGSSPCLIKTYPLRRQLLQRGIRRVIGLLVSILTVETVFVFHVEKFVQPVGRRVLIIRQCLPNTST